MNKRNRIMVFDRVPDYRVERTGSQAPGEPCQLPYPALDKQVRTGGASAATHRAECAVPVLLLVPPRS